MDLRSYFGPLRRHLWLIVVIALLAAAAGWLISWQYGKTSYSGELYATIGYTDDQATPDYKYGNYYANFAAIEFARTASGWLQSAPLVDKIYADAGVDMRTDVGLLGRLFGPISIKRIERANLLMSFKSASRENAERLLAALRDNFNRQLASYNAASATRYTLTNAQGRINTNAPNPPLSAALGLIAGLVAGVLLAYLVEYATGAVIAPEQARDAFGEEPAYVLHHRDHALAEVLASHLACADAPALLTGVSLDPSGLALRIAERLRLYGRRVTLIEGEPGLRLLRHRRGAGWSDEARAGKGAVKIPAKLVRPLGTDIGAVPFGKNQAATIGRLLAAGEAGTLGVLTFPRGARQLVDLPADTPVLVVAQLGLTRQRDLRHLRSFIGERPHALVLLS